MRSKWAKYCSSRSSTVVLALTLLLAPARALAALTVTSLQSTGSNDKFYFAGNQTGGSLTAYPGVTNPAFPDPDPAFHFRILNYSDGSACGQGIGTCDLSAGIEFDVVSDKTSFSTVTGFATSVLVVHVFQSNGATNQTFAPIAAVNGQRCDGSICATLGQNIDRNYYMGAIFNPGDKLRITLMPRDICQMAFTPPAATTGTPPSFQ